MSLANNKNGIFPLAGTDNADRKLDILLMHGLGGDAFSTWQYDGNPKYFWPKALVSDIADLGVWTIGYGATASGWVEDVMPMEDRAENLLNQLMLKGIGTRPFALITHSMGGLIAKYMLTQAAQSNNTDYQQIAQNCQGIVFLAVPHNGSGWSTLLDYARILVRGNTIVAQLAKDSSALRQLDKNFSQLSQRLNLSCYAFFETKEIRVRKKAFGFVPLSKGIQIVSESSASSPFLTEPAIPMDDDHISICKLRSKEDQLYGNMLRIIRYFLSANSSVDLNSNLNPDVASNIRISNSSTLNENTNIETPLENSQNMPSPSQKLPDSLSELTQIRNQKRLDSLYKHLDALQDAYDLETRIEEKMRIQALIEAKQADIDKLIFEK
jgi:pimeloyl-ACP methyl ester carboxylesterase